MNSNRLQVLCLLVGANKLPDLRFRRVRCVCEWRSYEEEEEENGYSALYWRLDQTGVTWPLCDEFQRAFPANLGPTSATWTPWSAWLIGFIDMGGKDDFSTRALEVVLIKKGIISEKKEEDEDDDYLEGGHRTVRSFVNHDSDSD